MDGVEAGRHSKPADIVAVAHGADGLVASAELALRFTLAVRQLTPTGQALRYRVALGPPDYDVTAIALHRQRGELWVASRDGTVRGFASADGRPLATWHLGSGVTALAITPSGAWLLTGTDDGVLCLRRSRDGALLQCVVAHQGPLVGLDVSDERAVSGSWDGSVTVWSLPALEVVAERRFPGSVNDVALADAGAPAVAIARSARPPHPAHLAGDEQPQPTPSDDLITLWWPAQPGRAELALVGHRAPVTSVAWADAGARLVSGSWDGAVYLWGVDAGGAGAAGGGGAASARLLSQSARFAGPVRDLAIAPDRARVVVGAWSDPRSLTGAATAAVPLVYPVSREPAHSD
ncbi:MAG: hypothetical protein Tsb0020_55740 [Haliangiales bacterium]